MAIQISPGINVSEFDNTTVVPAVATTTAALAGVFTWGPGYQRTLIDSENTLIKKFGKPTDNNFETFFTGANFLSYGNALYVVRGYDDTAVNAAAPAGVNNVVPQQVGNLDEFDNTTVNANNAFLAKYPGSLGNSLKISVCDSATAYSSNLTSNVAVINFVSGSNIATVNAYGTAQGSGNTAANSVLSKITVGDYIKAGNSTVGYQYLKVSSITLPTGAETSNSGNYYATGAKITFASNYTLASDVSQSSNTVQRFWEFYNAVDKAPGTSTYASNLGLTVKDEIHAVVVDNAGQFTGTPGQVLEVWSGLSRATDATLSGGSSNYYKKVLNTRSEYVYVGADRAGAATGTATSLTNASTTSPFTAAFASGLDGASESAITLGPIAQAYDLFKSKEDIDISLVLQGRAIGYGSLGNYIISNIAETRKDCVVFVSPDNSIVTKSDPVSYAVNFRSAINGVSGITYNSSYAFMDGNYKYQYDKYNDTYRWVPFNGDMAGLCAATDFSRDAWYSPAGFNRGQIKNVVKLLYNPSKAQQDELYKNDINPIVTFQGQGTVLYGDKTMYGKPSSFDRINVRRLFIVLEKAIAKAAQSSMFEFNDSFTRNQFVNLVEPFLRQVQGRRGIVDFKVVCDETNNTPYVIDSNGFVGDIFIKPTRSINFIQLNFVAVPTGLSFAELTGTAS